MRICTVRGAASPDKSFQTRRRNDWCWRRRFWPDGNLFWHRRSAFWAENFCLCCFPWYCAGRSSRKYKTVIPFCSCVSKQTLSASFTGEFVETVAVSAAVRLMPQANSSAAKPPPVELIIKFRLERFSGECCFIRVLSDWIVRQIRDSIFLLLKRL